MNNQYVAIVWIMVISVFCLWFFGGKLLKNNQIKREAARPRPTLQTIVTSELYAAEKRLIRERGELEDQEATVKALDDRVIRLRGQLKALKEGMDLEEPVTEQPRTSIFPDPEFG